MLYIVSTPIGNLKDITLRAIETLQAVDFIVCEDTRISQKLLTSLGIKKTMIVHNDHELNIEKIISKLQNNLHAALISDAGTPMISDPGFKLMKAIEAANIPIDIIPGPCSIIAALTLSKLPIDKFIFLGFLPKSFSQQQKLLQNSSVATTVVFESAKRLAKSLENILNILNNPQVSVVREITKTFQEVKNGNCREVLDYFIENPPKGEVIILIEKKELEISENEIKDFFVKRKGSVKDTIKILKEKNPSLSKTQLYNISKNISC